MKKNPDAQAYRDAAAIIAAKSTIFCCHALKHSPEAYFPGVDRKDLVKPFVNTFEPFKNADVFWNEDATDITKTNSAKHSRECRIFALLFMAEMTESP